MGPVVGIVGALMAELALRALSGRGPRGHLWTFEGKTDNLRRVPVSARADCPLCGARPSIRDVHESRYVPSPRAQTSCNVSSH
jgi:hypothetical protein